MLNYTVTVRSREGEEFKMKETKLTISEFAKIHQVNKRTLHYYDEIGLFSPCFKADNNYRYYGVNQSMEFEFLLMLKELNLSLAEIKHYLNQPNEAVFIELSKDKLGEIDQQIDKLVKTKQLLQKKISEITTVQTVSVDTISVIECQEETVLIAPYTFNDNDLTKAFAYVRDIWGIEQYRLGIGSYIEIEKVKNRQFDVYAGLFSPMTTKNNHQQMIRPMGRYLCGYHQGSWETLPTTYERLLDYAEANGLDLIGMAYESSLNDLVKTKPVDHLTKIMIQVK